MVAGRKTLNAAPVLGMRWLLCSDHGDDNLKCLAEAVLPSDTSKIKAGSGLAFLWKVLRVLYASDLKKDKSNPDSESAALNEILSVKLEAKRKAPPLPKAALPKAKVQKP